MRWILSRVVMADSNDSNPNTHYPGGESWIEAYIENQDLIIDYLDDVRSLSVYDPARSRDYLRKFANRARFSEAFNAVFFAVRGYEDFINQAEEVAGEQAAEQLRGLSSRYSSLERDIHAVYLESQLFWNNPVDYTEAEISTSQPAQARPLITQRLFSGDLQISEITAPPHHLILLGASILEDVRSVLEDREEPSAIEEQQVEQLHEAYGLLEEQVDTFSEFIDEELDKDNLEKEGDE